MQLSIVSVALLIDSLELDDVESCFCKAFGVVFGPLSDGGGESKGGGADGGIEGRVKGEDCLGQRWQDQWVVLTGDIGDEAKRDGGSCWRQRDFCKSGAGWWLWGRGDARHVMWRAVRFIRQVIRSIGHLFVSFAVMIFAKVCMLISVGMSDVTEQGGEQNVGILTR